MDKIYVQLTETSNKKGFIGEKNGMYYYVFPAGGEKAASTGVLFWALMYSSAEAFKEKVDGKKVDADFISSIKEYNKDGKTRLSGMLFKNEEKQAFFVNLYDNEMKSPEKNYDKLMVLTQTERREKPQAPAEENAQF